MGSRAIRKGQLRLCLMAIPVELHPAIKSGAQVFFRQIKGSSDKPVRYEKTMAGIGPVKSNDILKGNETRDGTSLLLEPDAIEVIKLDTKKTLEMVLFIDQSAILPLYHNKTYFVVPTDDLAADACRVVRDALRATKKTALGRLTMHGREYLCAIRFCGHGLMLATLRYEDEIREAEPLFASIKDGPATLTCWSSRLS